MSKSTLKSKVIYAVKVVSLLTVFAVMGTVIVTACWCIDNLRTADNPIQAGRDSFLRKRTESEWRERGLAIRVAYTVRTEHWTAYYITFAYPLEEDVPSVTRWVVLDDSNRRYSVPIDKL